MNHDGGGYLPGNVRRLRNVATELVISSRGRTVAQLDEIVRKLIAGGDSETAPESRSVARRVTDDDIRVALRAANYNYSAAANALGIHRSTLYDRTPGDWSVESRGMTVFTHRPSGVRIAMPLAGPLECNPANRRILAFKDLHVELCAR